MTDSFKEKVKLRMTGKIHTAETRDKMSKSHKLVDKSYLTGRVLTAETRKKIGNSKRGKAIGVGKVLTEQHKQAIRDGAKRKISYSDAKECANLIKLGHSYREVAISYHTSHSTIKDSIKYYKL